MVLSSSVLLLRMWEMYARKLNNDAEIDAEQADIVQPQQSN